MAATKVDEATGCWLWQRSTNHGHGQVHWRGTNWLAHRAVYAATVADPPPPVLHHECHTRACVNPAHLMPLDTNAEHRRVHADERTHCVHGHEFTPENTYYRPDGGGRQCRKCKAAVTARERERMTESEKQAYAQRIADYRRARTGARKRPGSRY